MVYVRINYEELDSLRKGILLYGLGGGMGNIAKIVAGTIIKNFPSKIVGYFHSKAFPDIVFSNKDGIVKINTGIYLYKTIINEKKFLILYGNLQPGILEDVGISLEERYNVLHELLKISKEIGIREIISLGGVGLEIEPEDPKIFIASNKKSLINKILEKTKEFGIEIYKNNNIYGMSGYLIALARYYKIPSYILLGETYSDNRINGYLSSSKILKILGKIYEFEIDTSKLIEKGNKIRGKISKFIEDLKKRSIEDRRRDRSTLQFYG